MHLAPYKSLLRIPGMRLFMLVALIARIPGTATGSALTLSVVIDRHLGYGDAGLAAAAYTLGLAVGSPLLGRVVDRRGPRPVLVVTGAAALAFWTTAPMLPFGALLATCALGGLLQVPVMALVRQSLAARVPQEQRRQAFSLDSMAVEVAFMVGPALAILMITQLGDAVSTLRALGFALAGSATVLFVYNPRVKARGAQSAADADGLESSGLESNSLESSGASGKNAAPVKPQWLAPGFLMVLGVASAACLVLAGTDVSIVATLRAHGQTQWAGITIIVWCAASMVGGFIHGAMPRPMRMLTLMMLLGALTIPVGVAHAWPLLCLALIPAGLACAPTVASTIDAVSRAVPESARGEAIGRHSSALTLGNAIGAPLAGLMIDHAGPAAGFATVGAVGALLALLAMGAGTLRGRGRRAEARAVPGIA